MDLDPPPPVIFGMDNKLLFAARAKDSDEQAIRAACHRGVALPRYVIVRRVGEAPKVYEVLGEGMIVVLDKVETEKLGG
jgi:hypothetical protein